MKGRGETLVAQAGEIEVVSADGLCQSFSTANQRKGSSQRLLNRFMVMSVLSYVDFYRPRYAFPKNVLDMAKCDVHGKEENVFAQTICGLVNRFFCLDAWSFDSPRSRTRVFISITAPGLTPLLDPPQTHAHPDWPGGPNDCPSGRYPRVGGRVYRRVPGPSGPNAWPSGRYSGVGGRVHRCVPGPSGSNAWLPDHYPGLGERVHRRVPGPSGSKAWPPGRYMRGARRANCRACRIKRFTMVYFFQPSTFKERFRSNAYSQDIDYQ